MTQKRATERRNQILRATFKAIAKKGFNSVTLQDIADYSGVSKGVTNYYFKNKEDVFYYLFSWITERIYQNERMAVETCSGAVNKLKAYVNAAFASPKKNKEFYRVYLEFLAQANHSDRYRDVNYQFYQNCWGIGKDIVLAGKEEGIFNVQDEERAAVTIRAMIDGSLIQWLMRNQDELHDYYRITCFEAIVNDLSNKDRQSYVENDSSA
ncbi:MAG: transcriptional regulator [Brevibacillus sp.]|nr:transcriptional regulator [Brevibacillus sp.]